MELYFFEDEQKVLFATEPKVPPQQLKTAYNVRSRKLTKLLDDKVMYATFS